MEKQFKLPKQYKILNNGAIVNLKRFKTSGAVFDGKEETIKCLQELIK